MVPWIDAANVCALSMAVESNSSRVCRSTGESRRVMFERCGMTRSAISCWRSAYCRYSALSSCQRLRSWTTLVAMSWPGGRRFVVHLLDDSLHHVEGALLFQPARAMIGHMINAPCATRSFNNRLKNISALFISINRVLTAIAEKDRKGNNARHRASPDRCSRDSLTVPRCRGGASRRALAGCGWPLERALRPPGPQDPAAEEAGEEEAEDWARRLSCRRRRHPLPQTSSRTYQRHLSSSA